MENDTLNRYTYIHSVFWIPGLLIYHQSALTILLSEMSLCWLAWYALLLLRNKIYSQTNLMHKSLKISQ